MSCFLVTALVATTAALATVSAFTGTATTAEIAPGRTIFLGTRFADRNGPTVKGLAIQSFDRFLSFLCGAHGDEAKATRALRHPIHDEMGVGDSSDGGEKLLKSLLSGFEGEISNVEFHMCIRVGTDIKIQG